MISDLPSRWREKAESLARYAPSAAEAFREAAETLEAEIRDATESPLTPEQIAASGLCSAETVRRAVRSGAVENVGSAGKILVRTSDTKKLPKGRGRKPKHSSYGPMALRVARTTRGRE